jgi:hypothetical protein
MITPVSFASIGYKTYIIFAVINAFIIPCVYFFYPETAYRSLEEMDGIFQQATNVFDVVRLARPDVTPNKYDKHGKFIMSDDVSLASGENAPGAKALEDKQRSEGNEAYQIEGGFAGRGEKGSL